jgi:DNA ligase-1
MNLQDTLLRSCLANIKDVVVVKPEPVRKKPSTKGRILLKKKDLWWAAEIDDNIIEYSWAKTGGAVQTLEIEVEDGKNIGRANETSPHEQAIIEVRAKINKKIMEGYNVDSMSGLYSSLTFKTRTECPSVMLAKKFDEHQHKLPDTVIVQPKLDGIRCMTNTITGEMFSRRKEPITSCPHISEAVVSMNLYETLGIEWLDGELYRHGKRLQSINSIVRTFKNKHKDAREMHYNVYDYISDESELERKIKMLDFPDNDYVNVVEHRLVNKKDVRRIQQEFIENGYEGTIIRDPNASYIQKRTDKLLKLKDFEDDEFDIIGVKKEEFKDTLGTFTLRMKSGKIFESRPAMPDEETLYIWQNRDKLQDFVATVKYFGFTDAGIPNINTTRAIRHRSDT